MQEKKFFFSVPDKTRICFPSGKIRTGEEDTHAIRIGMAGFLPHRARVAFGNSCCLCEQQTFYWLAYASQYRGSSPRTPAKGTKVSPAGSVGALLCATGTRRPFGIRMFAGIQLLISMLLPRESPAGAPRRFALLFYSPSASFTSLPCRSRLFSVSASSASIAI